MGDLNRRLNETFFDLLNEQAAFYERKQKPTLCSCVATSVWKPGEIPKPSSWMNGGSS